MTDLGAFGYFLNDGAGKDGTYTLIKTEHGRRNQDTGARIATTRTNVTIKGSLDPMSEEDLTLLGAAHFTEGDFKFHCADSDGVETGDVIVDNRGRQFRVLNLLNTAPLVRKVMGGNADPVSWQVRLTKEGRKT